MVTTDDVRKRLKEAVRSTKEVAKGAVKGAKDVAQPATAGLPAPQITKEKKPSFLSKLKGELQKGGSAVLSRTTREVWKCKSCGATYPTPPPTGKCDNCGGTNIRPTLAASSSGMLAAFISSFSIIIGCFIWVLSPVMNFFSWLLSLTPYTSGMSWAPYALVILLALGVAAFLFKRGVWTAILGSVGIVIGVFVIIGIVGIVGNLPIIGTFEGGKTSINDLIKNVGIPDASCYLKYWNSPMMWGSCVQQQEEEYVPQYVGTKKYNLLKINLGHDPFGDKNYRIPIVYANPKEDDDGNPVYDPNYEYELPFYIENLDKKQGEDEGETLTDVSVIYVYAYKNEKITDTDRPFIRLQNVDICNRILPCDIPPEDRTKVFASDFDEFTVVGGEIVEMKNTIPCKVSGLYRLSFEMGVEYDMNATHDRTFIVIRSEEDKEIVNKDQQLKDSLKTFAPSDGPIDLIIDFSLNPYTLGERPYNKLRVSAWIINEELDGGYIPKELVLNTVGELPRWLDQGAAEGCSLYNSGGNGVIDFGTITAAGLVYDPIKEYKCTIQINEGGYPSSSAFQTVSFSGKFVYTYRELIEFPSDDFASVDRSDCEDTGEDIIVEQPDTCTADSQCFAVDTDSVEDGDGDKPLVGGTCTPYICKESISECVPELTPLRDVCSVDPLTIVSTLIEYINSANLCVQKIYQCDSYCSGTPPYVTGSCNAGLNACECSEEAD